MEQVLGRRLLRTELVHHIDENRQNNKPKNLKLTTRAEHPKEHATTFRNATHKECTLCHDIKPRRFFYKNSLAHDGNSRDPHHSRCIDCGS